MFPLLSPPCWAPRSQNPHLLKCLSSTETMSNLPHLIILLARLGDIWRDCTKAKLPDGISSRVLRTCACQLSTILWHLFNLSINQEKVPVLWKMSYLFPVPKKTIPSCLSNYWPVALTFHVMKVLERLVLAQFNSSLLVSDSLQNRFSIEWKWVTIYSLLFKWPIQCASPFTGFLSPLKNNMKNNWQIR